MQRGIKIKKAIDY